jgi:hypothetical protein
MAHFLDALKSRCTVHEVNGGRDWRLGTGDDLAKDGDVQHKTVSWYGLEERAQFEKAVQDATGGAIGAFAGGPGGRFAAIR